MARVHAVLMKAVKEVAAEYPLAKLQVGSNFKCQVFSGNSHISIFSTERNRMGDKRDFKNTIVVISALEKVEVDENNTGLSNHRVYNFNQKMLLADFARQLAYYAKQQGGILADTASNLNNFKQFKQHIFSDFEIEPAVIIAWLRFFDTIFDKKHDLNFLVSRSGRSKASGKSKRSTSKKSKHTELGGGYVQLPNSGTVEIRSKLKKPLFSVKVEKTSTVGKLSFQFYKDECEYGVSFSGTKKLIRAACCQYLKSVETSSTDSYISNKVNELLPRYVGMDVSLFVDHYNEPINLLPERLVYFLLEFTRNWDDFAGVKTKEPVAA